MNQTTMFRFLVLASIAMAVLGAIVDAFVPGVLPPALDDAYEAYAAAEEPTLSQALTWGALALVLLVGVVVGTIGLLLYKPWGRQLSLWLSVLTMLISPFFGPVVYSGWASTLTETSMMLWGAALAMAYFADIKVMFERNAPNKATQ